MNPFRSPTSEEAPVDDSVLAVCTLRRRQILFALLFWTFTILWTYGATKENGLYSTLNLASMVMVAVSTFLTWIALHRQAVLSIGSTTITFYASYTPGPSCLTLKRPDIASAEWAYGYEVDTLKLRLKDPADGSVYKSKVWSKSTPGNREVCWLIDRDASLTHERSQIREALQQWLSDAFDSAENKQLTVARST